MIATKECQLWKKHAQQTSARMIDVIGASDCDHHEMSNASEEVPLSIYEQLQVAIDGL